MLDINNPVQWQLRDDTYPTLMPWFTHNMLKAIKNWEDLSAKSVFEWGGGWSSIFWAFYCEMVVTVETDEKWINDIREYAALMGLTNIQVIHRQVNEGDRAKIDYYTEIPDFIKPDIICVDGVLRHECLLKALALPRPLTIIHDNWQQDGFVCPASEEIMLPHRIHNFIQEDHTDNHGKKWATAYWELK
jgi:hypothetical protein